MRRTVLVTALISLVAAAPATAAKKAPSKHGDLISAKPFKGADSLSGAAKNLRVRYRSIGVGGKLVTVTGTIALPKSKAPKGGWPVISWAHGTTGIGPECAPSTTKLDNAINPLLNKALKAGFTIVRTDYIGMGGGGVHPYLNGETEGHAVLDIIRAARKDSKKVGRTIEIIGHSQGGHAALWASALAKKYTPELKLTGTVAMAPASHIGEQASLIGKIDSTALSPLAGLILRGVSVARPDLNIESMLTDAARAVWPATLKCNADVGKPDSWGSIPTNAIIKPDVNIQPIVDYLNANDPESLTIRTPVLVQQGLADATVIPAFTAALVKDINSRGGKVVEKEYPGVDHGGLATDAKSTGDALAFLRKHR